MTRTERIRGGLYGLLVGDALGVPYEFHDPSNLPDRDDIDMVPPEGFNRSHRGTPVGTWSDDGAQALALLETVLSCEGFDAAHFGANLVAWWNEGAFTPDGRAFDIGNQTTTALEKLEAGVPALQAGGGGERDNGNGSLMRVLPLALWHTGTDGDLVRDAQLQSRVTHAHPRSQACCALYSLWARRILEEADAPYNDALDTLLEIYQHAPAHSAELQRIQQPYVPRGTGYVLDCLHSARVAPRCRLRPRHRHHRCRRRRHRRPAPRRGGHSPGLARSAPGARPGRGPVQPGRLGPLRFSWGTTQ